MEILSVKDLKNKVLHFVGIGGISMSSLALFAKRAGAVVQGSDEAQNDEVIKLKNKGIKIYPNHKKTNLKNVDCVIYSSAIQEDNEELCFARDKNILIFKRAEFLGLIAEDYKNIISIAGSHGKTTATAMIVEMLDYAKQKPTFHLGGVDNKLKSNYKVGNKKFFVTESCEYKDNFLYLSPDISVILNIDADHLDYFKTLDGVKNSFYKFSKRTKLGGVNVVCYDDENSSELLSADNVITFGLNKKADIYARKIKEYKPCHYSFEVVFFGLCLGDIKLQILGEHNILNALACIAVGLLCAIDFCDIKFALENFSGVKRRCQKIGELNGAEIYHDYAHHPKQVEKMIDIAHRLALEKGDVFVVFEPHTYSRTKLLYKNFVKSLSRADEVYLAPVYSAREQPSKGYDSKKLYDGLKNKTNTKLCAGYSEIEKELKRNLKPHDVVMILGAGTIEKLADKFKN